MSNKKQTAVEWLEFEINKRGPKENNPPKWLKELYEQAKAMEREQRLEDFKSGFQAAFDSLQGANNLVQKKTYDIHREKGKD